MDSSQNQKKEVRHLLSFSPSAAPPRYPPPGSESARGAPASTAPWWRSGTGGSCSTSRASAARAAGLPAGSPRQARAGVLACGGRRRRRRCGSMRRHPPLLLLLLSPLNVRGSLCRGIVDVALRCNQHLELAIELKVFILLYGFSEARELSESRSLPNIHSPLSTEASYRER